MDFYKSSLYIYNLNFPMRKEYLSNIGNYNKRLNTGFSFINNEFNILLRKSKKEEFIEEKKQKKLLMIKLLEEKKQKRIRAKINKQKKMEMNKRITKSISNNKMLLNIMSNCKPFIKYLIRKQKYRNNNCFSESNFSANNRKSNLIIKPHKSKVSYTFMTELSNNNFSPKKRENKKISHRTQNYQIRKFNSISDLRHFEFNGLNKKNKTMRINNNFSDNYLIGKKKSKITNLKNKIKLSNFKL